MLARIIDYFLRAVAAAILLPVGYQKIVADPDSVSLFQELGMEPHGRVIIGLVEVAAGLLLLSPGPGPGALLAISVMIGAIIAHATRLGLNIGDGGLHVGLLIVVFAASVVILLRHRQQIPLVGYTLKGNG